MITSMDDMCDDGFVAEASRWIVQNCGSHIPSAGELQLACTCLIRDNMVACMIVRLSTIVHAALLWALPDGDLRVHLLMVNTGCTPARSRSSI